MNEDFVQTIESWIWADHFRSHSNPLLRSMAEVIYAMIHMDFISESMDETYRLEDVTLPQWQEAEQYASYFLKGNNGDLYETAIALGEWKAVTFNDD